MIRKFLSRRVLLALGSILAVSLIFSACKKNNDEVTQTPVAGLMAFNLAPDQPGVYVSLSGNLLGGGAITYPGFTGQYLNIFPGNRLVESFSASGNQGLDSLTYNFEPKKYYSVFVLGAGSNYKNVVTVDNYDSLTASSGKAYVRFINGLSNAANSNVSITSGGSNVVNKSAAFGEVSEFLAVNPGDISVAVSNDGAANANRTIQVAEHKAYTILLTGLPNQADSSRSVQVRFVENGTVTD
jgi:hypothetical protein